MHFKKLLALLVSAALMLSLLAGCGGGKSQSLSQMLLNLLDGQYQNVSVEIDSDLEAKLRQAIRQSETDEELRAALEQLLGGGISFQRLGSGQQGDSAWTLIIYPGTDPDAAARSVYLDLDKVFAALPADGVYSSGFAMAEMENGYAILVRATVDKAGTEDKPDPVTLESIKVTKEPDREYWAGQPFNPDGMEITATYSNGTTKTLKDIKQNGDQGVKWTPDGALATSDTSITITYGGKTTTVSVTVKEPAVKELKVEHTSLTYTAGAYFSPNQIGTVTASYTYGNDKEINISECDLILTLPDNTTAPVDSSYQFKTAGTYTLTVSYSGQEATVKITVNPATVTGIEVTTLPTRTTYFDGESFDPAGMIVSKVYSNGTKTAVTDYTYSPGPLTKDNNVVTISYGGESTTVEVTILGENNSYDADTKTYSIATAEGLMAWNEAAQSDPSLNCTLTSNIDLTGEWTPIGTESQPYTGTFDGNGKTITGLKIDQSGTDYVGLIGRLGSGGTVKNVVLTEVNITSGTFVGGVAGWSFGGHIENCSVSGSVSGSDVGGVVGYQQGGSITGCSSSATVKGTQRAGGVAGRTNYGAKLTACYATGNVTGTGTGTAPIYVGGVTGSNDSGTLTACYHANGTVSGPGGATGGVVGYNNGTVNNCYWSGSPEKGIGSGKQAGSNEYYKDTHQNMVTTVEVWDELVAAMDTAGYILKGSCPTPTGLTPKN